MWKGGSMAKVRKIKRKNGFRYMVDFYDQNNERQRMILPEGTLKKDAEDKRLEIEQQLQKGVYVPEKKILNFNEVAEKWLEYKKPNLRSSTWSVYEGHVRNHFEDFEDRRINRIHTSDIETYILERQKEGMPIGTIRKILVSLGQIFKYAVRHKYVSYNPIVDAERPRKNGRVKEKKIRILKPEEIKTFLSIVENEKYRTLFKLAIATGARQGELLGLKWPDIDWKNSQVKIRRTFNNQQWYEPKTAQSRRNIDIGPSMVTDLKKWKLACPTCELNLVFPNEAGGPINHNNMVNRHFNPALKKAGIERIRFHDIRHSFASMLIEQGENIKYIQKQLGHSSPTVTLNVYSHLMRKQNPEAAARLEEAIF
jgi:integrase